MLGHIVSEQFTLTNLFGAERAQAFLNDYFLRRSFAVPDGSFPSALCNIWPALREAIVTKQKYAKKCVQVDYFSRQKLPEGKQFISGWEEGLERLDSDGGTICITHAEELVPELKELCHTLHEELGILSVVGVNAYASSIGEGFTPHYDSQCSFMVQVVGSKTWHFKNTPITNFPNQAKQLNEKQFFEQCVKLNPGSILVLPPGTPHEACADTFSVGLNFSIRPILLSEVLNHHVTTQLRMFRGAGLDTAISADGNILGIENSSYGNSLLDILGKSESIDKELKLVLNQLGRRTTL